MGDFSFGASFALVLRTWPFLLVRAAVYFGIAAAFAVAAGGGAGIGWAIGALGGPAGRVPGAFWGAVAGIAAVALMLRWLREYLLYLVRAGHVAAMMLVLDGESPPPALGLIGQSVALVQRRFRDMATLVAIERLVRGTLAHLIALVDPAARLLPAGATLSTAPLNSILRGALGFLPDAVLARPLRAAAGNPWRETRDALLHLAHRNDVVLQNALLLAAAAYGAAFVVFLIALAPAASLVQAYPGDAAPLALMLAVIFAWSFKQALIEPFVVASLLQVLFRAAERPDPAWDEKLTVASEEFREIKARAARRTAS